MELTEQQKQHICAELARHIWPEAEIRLEYEGDGVLYMINPTPTTSGTGWQCFDPFTDAAASRALRPRAATRMGRMGRDGQFQ